MTKKDVAVKAEDQAVAVQQTAPRGFEDEDSSDLLLPRIELLQGLSPSVTEGKGKPGDIVNQISKQPLATNIFLPITLNRKYIKWFPRDEGGGVEYQTTDKNDPKVVRDLKWGDDGTPPSVTAYMNFLVLLEGSSLPIVLSFAMTNYNTGKKLYTLCKMAGKDMWCNKYKLSSKLRTNAKGSWHVFDVDEAGASSDEDIATAEKLYNAFASQEIKFEDENSNKPKQQASKDEDY